MNTELRDKMNVLHGQMVALGDTWRDQEHEKFAHEFEQTLRAVISFARYGEAFAYDEESGVFSHDNPG